MYIAREVFESIDGWMGAMEFAGYSHCHLVFVREGYQVIMLLSSDENRIQEFERIINDDFTLSGLAAFRAGANPELECRGVDTHLVRSEAVERLWREWVKKTLAEDSDNQEAT